jgi:hypothetical protein
MHFTAPISLLLALVSTTVSAQASLNYDDLPTTVNYDASPYFDVSVWVNVCGMIYIH